MDIPSFVQSQNGFGMAQHANFQIFQISRRFKVFCLTAQYSLVSIQVKLYLVKDLEPKQSNNFFTSNRALSAARSYPKYKAGSRNSSCSSWNYSRCVSVIVLFFLSPQSYTCVAPVVLAAIFHARKCSLIQLSLSSVFRYNRKKENNEAFQIILRRNNHTNSLWQNTKL